MARRGEFQEDLLYRLNVVTIYLPPLRERQDDLLTLLHHYIARFSERIPAAGPADEGAQRCCASTAG